MKYFTILTMLILIISCNKKQEKITTHVYSKIEKDNDFFPEYRGDIKSDTLYLYVELMIVASGAGQRMNLKCTLIHPINTV